MVAPDQLPPFAKRCGAASRINGLTKVALWDGAPLPSAEDIMSSGNRFGGIGNANRGSRD